MKKIKNIFRDIDQKCESFSIYSNSIVFFQFSKNNINFVRLFHFVGHYVLHRLLYFIRAVCFPTPAFLQIGGVGLGGFECTIPMRCEDAAIYDEYGVQADIFCSYGYIGT